MMAARANRSRSSGGRLTRWFGGAAPRARKDTTLLANQMSPWRSKLLVFAMFCAFAALSVRVFYLQGGVSTGFLQRQGEVRYARTLKEQPVRGSIYDRNGVVLASSVLAKSVWVDPGAFKPEHAELRDLAKALDTTPEEIQRRVLAEEKRNFVYLKRQIEPELADRIDDMAIAGVHTEKEYRRQYPQGEVTAHLLGFTNVAERGLEGVERVFEGQLGGQPGLRHLIEDRLGHTIEDDWLREPVQGRDVHLSIDDRIQYIAHAAVKQAAQANAAQAASAVVLDARSGEVLALANWPDFDPTQRVQADPNLFRDRAVTDTFEPGSTLKPFSIATALEAGIVRPDTVIDTSPGSWVVNGKTITDSHRHGPLTVEEVLAKSSNVGTSKIALQLPARRLWESLTAVGFGQTPQAELSGAVAGRLKPATSWRPIEQATISYGYGISVSLLQLAHAYLVFARQGNIVPVSVQRVDTPAASVQVFSPATVMRVRHMLEMATGPEGTAPAARIPGYRVAGKTGTARKLRGGHYVDAYVSSFAGFAPASDPRIVVAVMVDEPRAGRFYGGDVAAPAFAAIASGTLRAMRVTPDDQSMQMAQAGASAVGVQ